MSIRLLVVSDGLVPSGLARVTHSILRRLSTERYDIHHLAINYNGDPHQEKWSIYPAAVGGDRYGFRRLEELVRKIRPDIVWTYHDLWIQREYLRILRAYTDVLRVVTYAPVESEPVDPKWLEDFGVATRFVVFSSFAQQALVKVVGAKHSRAIQIIPHGVDTSVFYPNSSNGTFAGKYEAKRKLGLVAENALEDSFIVLNANRNQVRKRIDITMEGFAEFSRDKPDNVKLYLHMGIEDSGWNVVELARRLGIDQRLILTECDSVPTISNEDLNTIYNACDVGVNTAACEGWGLVSFEHAATCSAQIVPRIPSLEPLWSECAEMIPPAWRFTYEKTLIDGYFIGADNVAAALERLYADTDYRRNAARACFANAVRDEYSWDQIASRWDALFINVLEE